MRMKNRNMFFFSLFAFVFIFTASLFAADKENFGTAPKTNDGKKWRIGYYEGGEYKDYPKNLIAVLQNLMELGWLETKEIPPLQGEALWNWVASGTKSDYVEFVKDFYHNAKWDKNLRPKIAAQIIDRLNNKKDIDLMLAFGTWAGQDLANDKHKTPTMVISVSDPLKSGIIRSIEDSGFDHVHACIDPLRQERQIRMFHDIIRFKKLGLAYENTDTGKSYGSIDMVEKVAKEKGFEIVSCHTKAYSIAAKEVAEESVKQCFETLGEKKVDAIYVTVQATVNNNTIPELVKIANSYKIPTFSQSGSEEVSYGFLMSFSRPGFKSVGRFHAAAIAKVFNGAKPRQLKMLFKEIPRIALNYKTAEVIKYEVPMSFLEIIDESYNAIAVPEKK